MRKPVTVVLVSVITGALITWLVLARTQHAARLGAAPEKFIPAQTLRLLDSTGQQFADLYVGSNRIIGFQLTDADGRALLQYTSGANSPLLVLYSITGNASEKPSFLDILMEREPVFGLHFPDGKGTTVWSKGWRHGSFASAIAKAAYEAVFPGKPEHTVEDTIPTEDVRLIDAQGRPFAIFGLNENGEPCFDLLDTHGRLLVSFGVSESGYFPAGDQPKQWPNLWLFDSRGKMRVQVELGPEPEPILTIFEDADPRKPDLGIYALDPQTGREVPKQNAFSRKEGAIPWLRHKMPRVNLPIVLVDQRGQVIWNSKGSRSH